MATHFFDGSSSYFQSPIVLIAPPSHHDMSNMLPSIETTRIDSAVIVCSASVVQQLTQARIPPNYIGVRRVPKPKAKTNAANQEAILAKRQQGLKFKITEADGTERRMTKQERKAMRQKLAQEQNMEMVEGEDVGGKRKASDMEQSSTSEVKDPLGLPVEDDANPPAAESPASESQKYHQLSVDPAAMEEELAEFSGDRREGLPPVMLAPAMVMCASNILLPDTPTAKSKSRSWIQYDEELSQKWARMLKESMLPAETVRRGEDMRPMAYQLTPEVWKRMRPEKNDHPRLETRISQSSFQGVPTMQTDSIVVSPSKPWVVHTCRPPSRLDVAMAAIFEYFYHETTFHVSCGAKFGADFLVYDGPRSQRHAFAGLRILLPKENELPIPTAYAMAGYVRCLNTAGKLALLATVVEDTSENDDGSKFTLYRVALADIALEKILTAPTHQRHARTEKRRDISRNLAKGK